MTTAAATSAAAPRTGLRIHPLVRFLGIRLVLTAFLLVGVTLVTFSMTNLVPGDPVQAALGEQAAANPEIVAAYRARMGLDQPLYIQYGTYLSQLLQGDLGTSIQTRQPVALELGRAVPATIELALAAIVVSSLLGVGLGMVAAMNRRTWIDQVIRLFSTAGISIPSFWLALVVYYVFFHRLGWFPGSGRLSAILTPPPRVTGFMTIDSLLAGDLVAFSDAAAHMIMPATVLALYTIGLLTRFARSAVLEVLDQDYVRGARAKGLPVRTVTLGYVLRGSLVPIVTVLGIAFGSLLSGTVLVENVYAWNGIGQYAYNAASKLDLPAIMGVGLVVGFVYIMMNLLVDIAYGFIDPRVRVR